jgi:hypothetical protein
VASPRRTRVICTVVLLSLVAFMGPESGAAVSAPSQATNEWWSSAYSFRVSITLSNPTSQNMTSEPVLVHVTFPVAHLVDAASELTLIENGTVVPSYVVDQTTSGGFVSSVWLLTIVSIQASSSQPYWLYYNDTSARTPSYRIQTQAATFTSGLLSITQTSPSPGSFYYQFSYGRTYSETVLSRVSYGTQAGDQFGTLEISANPLQQISPWRAIANDSQLLATVANFAATSLYLDRVDILSGSTASTIYLIRNAGNTTLNNITLVNVLDTSSLASIAPSYTLFDLSSGSLIATVGGALVGFEGSLYPSAFGLGPYGQVVNQTRTSSFNSQARSYGPSAGALSWGIGSLEPGSTAEFGTSWSVSSNVNDLHASLASIRSSPTVTVGAEETFQSLLPTANVYWKSSLSLSNVTFGSRGLTFPMTIQVQGGTWLPESATFSGELSYFTPAPDFEPAHSGLWSADSKATGNATAAASAAFFSVQDSSYVGRISSTTSASNSTAVSSLVSSRQVVLGSQPAEFTLKYRASFSGSGNASAQALYAAIDIDHTLTGVYDESLLLPVLGASGNLACFPGGSTLFSHPVVSTPTNLFTGRTWRTLNVSLGNATSALGFGFRVRFCASMGPAFVGSMELDVAKAGLTVNTSTDGVVVPGLSAGVPMASLGPALQLPSIPSNALLNGNLSFMLVTSGTMAQQGGISFSTNSMAAPTVRLNGSIRSTGSVLLNTSVESVLVTTPFVTLGPILYVGGSQVSGASVANSSIFAQDEGLADAWNNSKQSAIIGVTFTGYVLRVSVTDANGSPVSGANLTISSPSALANSGLTNHEGVASVQLVPWAYNISVKYQGLVVAKSNISARALVGSPTLHLGASVIQTNLDVKNVLGSPLIDVLVTVVGPAGSAPIQGVTDQNGRFSFQAPEESVYHVAIVSGGSIYFKGDIKAIVNNGVIVITTSYYPETLWVGIMAIGIAVTVTIVLATSVVAPYFRSRRTH